MLIFAVGCINIEEEPILLVNPTAEISAHVKNEKIYATVQDTPKAMADEMNAQRQRLQALKAAKGEHISPLDL